MIPAMASPRRAPIAAQMITSVLRRWEFEAVGPGEPGPGKPELFGGDELPDGKGTA